MNTESTHSSIDLSEDDHPKESCGIFGVYGHPEAAKLTYFGLYALQHRGQESAGIAVAKDDAVNNYKAMAWFIQKKQKSVEETIQGRRSFRYFRPRLGVNP